MGFSIFDKIQAKLELLRLEKRYTRSRHRRSAFISNAVYVDGEYVLQTPNSTGSSTSTTGTNALHGNKAGAASPPAPDAFSEDEEDAYNGNTNTRHNDDDQDNMNSIYRPPKLPSKRFSLFNLASPPPPPTDDFFAPTPRKTDIDAEERQRRRLNRHSSMPGFGGTYDVSKSTSRFSERRLSMIR
ncbi:hypothetical protein GMORB2_1255 [Geosmithia morbida]|uniref:Uncharacterized protein n=1 Tax=Geosmithia morbida TaxID=1094350 RepID=A0A9P4Z232_9HYPO|nr:uncharacterized protein GMORB2_1255 [Geosmithia morbida]KAF4126009.1 hypothetical protein GMORB2_1255 [Geosmithia morbida]